MRSIDRRLQSLEHPFSLKEIAEQREHLKKLYRRMISGARYVLQDNPDAATSAALLQSIERSERRLTEIECGDWRPYGGPPISFADELRKRRLAAIHEMTGA